MKKLKVDYTSHEIEADTIDILKDSIVVRFSLTADHLSQQRLLVRDNRDLLQDRSPITGCVDLLQLADGSILDGGGDLCKDGDTLVLGWKGPFTVHLEIETLVDDPLAEENLPQVLIDGDDEKPLLFFGYYRFWKSYDLPFVIYYKEENIPERGSPILRVVTYPTEFRASDSIEAWKKLKVMVVDDDGNESFIPITEFIIEEPNEEDKKYDEEMRRIRQSKENMENLKKKKNNKRKMEYNGGDLSSISTPYSTVSSIHTEEEDKSFLESRKMEYNGGDLSISTPYSTVSSIHTEEEDKSFLESGTTIIVMKITGAVMCFADSRGTLFEDEKGTHLVGVDTRLKAKLIPGFPILALASGIVGDTDKLLNLISTTVC